MTFDPAQRSIGIVPHTMQFVAEYWESRNIGHLLRGIPCILAGLGVLACLSISSEIEPRTTQRYRAQANQHIKSENFADAALLLRRIVNRNPHDQDAWFQLAQTISRSGNQPHAMQMMRDIAPRDERGYRPAHIWLARTQLESLGNDRLSESKFDLILADLLRVQDIPTFKQETAPLLAKLYLQQGLLSAAEPFLSSMSEQGAEQRFSVAKSLQRLGRVDDARREAGLATTEIAALLKQQPDQDARRIALAECSLLAQRPQVGEQALRDGISLNPTGPCRVALSQFYLKWSSQLATEDAQQHERLREDMLHKALDLLKNRTDLTPGDHLFAAELALAVRDAQVAEFHLKRTNVNQMIPRLNLARLLADQQRSEDSRRMATVILTQCRNQLASLPPHKTRDAVQFTLQPTPPPQQ